MFLFYHCHKQVNLSIMMLDLMNISLPAAVLTAVLSCIRLLLHSGTNMLWLLWGQTLK